MNKAKNKKLLLVIEDDQPIRKALVNYLTREGYSVHEATNGEEGFEIAERDNPDLIVLDIMMPGMSGQEVLEKLRNTEWGQDTPVVVLSNADEKEHFLTAVNYHADYFLKVDARIEDIVETIKEKLR